MYAAAVPVPCSYGGNTFVTHIRFSGPFPDMFALPATPIYQIIYCLIGECQQNFAVFSLQYDML